MSRVIFLVLSFFCVVTMQAQLKYVNEFLNIGVGARAQGMFGSVAATTHDASAGYWNTAGLASLEPSFQASAMHANWFSGIANYDYISIAKRFSSDHRSAGGLTLIRMSIDNIPNTINLIAPDGSINYDNITSFSAADYAGLISYARSLGSSERWAIGGNIKIIHRSIGSFGSAWGFGSDLAFQYKSPTWSFGLVARDITTTYNAWTFNLTEKEKEVFYKTGNEIPSSSTESTLPRLILAAAYHNSIGKFSYLIETDLNISTDGRASGIIDNENLAIDPSFGLELGFANRVFIRGGLGNIQRVLNPQNYSERDIEYQPNVGVGLNLGRLKVDYALANIGGIAGVNESHIFSLTLDFNNRQSDEEAKDL